MAARARLLRIEDTRRDEPAYVDSLLRNGDADVRAAAALTVGRLGARGHLPALRLLAAGADTAVAANSFFSLGLIKDSASAIIAAAALRGPASAGIEAAWHLGEVGGRTEIVAGLADPSVPAVTRSALLLAAARLRPLPVSAIVPFLASPDSAIAWRAAYALSRGRSTAGARPLYALAASPWPAVREQVARAAVRGIAGDSLGNVALAALRVLVRDTSAFVRVNAVRAIASYPGTRAVILESLRDPDAAVRLTAAQSVDAALDSAAFDWQGAFMADTSLVVQRAIADAASIRGIDLAERAQWAVSDDWQRRVAAAQLQSRAHPLIVLERLGSRAGDRDGRVRAAVAGAMRGIADSAATREVVRATFRAFLADSDIGVRAASLSALARGATVDDLAAALASHQRAASDADGDARLAFWRLADSVLRRAPVLPDSVEQKLAALERPADATERALAARVARFTPWRDASGTARPLAWYEDRTRDAEVGDSRLRIETERGVVELRLHAREAPLTVFNITSLARRGYFDGQRFHRVVPNFVAQAGDPRGDGSGGPGYVIRDELNRFRYGRGTLGMALSGPDTGGSQFFITHSPQPHLDGGYTIFGQLLSGGAVLDRIVQGDRIVRVTVH